MTDNQANKPASLGAQFLLLQQEFTSFKGEVEQKFNTLAESIANLSREIRAARPSLIKIATPVALLLGGFWFVITLYFGNANQTTRETLSAVSANDKAQSEQIGRLIELSALHTQQNAQSKQDRDDQRAALARLTDVTAELAKTVSRENAERTAKEAEIETQFDADSQLRNVQWAMMQRKMNDFQNAFHDMGAKMPAAADGPYFFPNISGRAH